MREQALLEREKKNLIDKADMKIVIRAQKKLRLPHYTIFHEASSTMQNIIPMQTCTNSFVLHWERCSQ